MVWCHILDAATKEEKCERSRNLEKKGGGLSRPGIRKTIWKYPPVTLLPKHNEPGFPSTTLNAATVILYGLLELKDHDSEGLSPHFRLRQFDGEQ